MVGDEHPISLGTQLNRVRQLWGDYVQFLAGMSDPQFMSHLPSHACCQQLLLSVSAVDRGSRRAILRFLGHFYNPEMGCVWTVRLVIPAGRWVSLNSPKRLKDAVTRRQANAHSLPRKIETAYTPHFQGKYRLVWDRLRYAIQSTTRGGFAAIAMLPDNPAGERLLASGPGAPCQQVNLWLRSLTSADRDYPFDYSPLEPAQAAAAVSANADPNAVQGAALPAQLNAAPNDVDPAPAAPLDAAPVVPATDAPTLEELARCREDTKRLVLAQNIQKSNLRTDSGADSPFKISRYRFQMRNLVLERAPLRDPLYRGLGVVSEMLEHPEVRQAIRDGVISAIDDTLMSDDDSYHSDL